MKKTFLLALAIFQLLTFNFLLRATPSLSKWRVRRYMCLNS